MKDKEFKFPLSKIANELLNEYILEEITTFFKKEQFEFIKWEKDDIFGSLFTEREIKEYFPIVYNQYLNSSNKF